MARLVVRLAAALILGRVLLGCAPQASPPEPAWVRLASAPGTHLTAPERAPRFGIPLPAELWRRGALPGQWVVPDPLEGSDLLSDEGSDPRLTAGERRFDYLPPLKVSVRDFLEALPPPGTFYFFNGRLHLHLAPEAELPADLTLSTASHLRVVRNGRSRIRTRRFAADGFVVRPGEPVELRSELPPGSALRYASFALVPSAAMADGTSVLRIELDGRELHEERRRPTPAVALERRTVALPESDGRVHTLRFTAHGGDAVWGIADPVAGPREPRPPGGRAERRNAVVFLADTLRADALTALGSPWDVSPNLDRFAERSALFERAWSTASWTLPAHASLFTGLYPYQHGARVRDLRLAEDFVTLAEHLDAAGYRTGAVTDSLFVSHRYGLDQGFQWFVEHTSADLAKTTESLTAFLDADDGRPFFLFVQTYHVHGPYEVEPDVLAEHGERLGIDSTWAEVMQRVAKDLEERGSRSSQEGGVDPESVLALIQSGRWTDSMHEAAEELHRIYLARVLQLDRAFGRWLGELAARGLAESTYVVFTSDHGEAFGEHDTAFHGKGVWQEILHVPLLLSGPGIEPGRVGRGASLVDLPRTLASLLGVEPHPDWMGVDLFGDTTGRTVFAFDCSQISEGHAVWIDGPWKVAVPATPGALEERDVEFAYDLAGDPAERDNLAGDLPREARAVLDENAAKAGALMTPMGQARAAELDGETLRQLEAMGYVGER